MQELYADKNIQNLKLDNDTEVTEIIILAELPNLGFMRMQGCANLTSLAFLAKIDTSVISRPILYVKNTKLRKITALLEQLDYIKINLTRTLRKLPIQPAEAKSQHLQIWQLPKNDQEDNVVVIFRLGGILQSKQRFDNSWRFYLLTSPLRLPIGK